MGLDTLNVNLFNEVGRSISSIGISMRNGGKALEIYSQDNAESDRQDER